MKLSLIKLYSISSRSWISFRSWLSSDTLAALRLFGRVDFRDFDWFQRVIWRNWEHASLVCWSCFLKNKGRYFTKQLRHYFMQSYKFNDVIICPSGLARHWSSGNESDQWSEGCTLLHFSFIGVKRLRSWWNSNVKPISNHIDTVSNFTLLISSGYTNLVPPMNLHPWFGCFWWLRKWIFRFRSMV